MFFSNLLGEIKGTVYRNRGTSMSITFTSNESVSQQRVLLVDKDGKKELIVSSANDMGMDIFDIKLSDDIFYDEYTYKDLVDTEDNPLIVVATKGIRFFNNTPTYIKVLFVNDGIMLIELVFGICQFIFDDGREVTLQRCNNEDLNTKTVYQYRENSSYIDCNTLKSLILCKTKGGYSKTFDIVCPLYVRASRTHKNGETYNSISFKCIDSDILVLEPDKIERIEQEEEETAKRKKEEAELRRQESEKKRKAEIERRKAEELEAIRKKREAMEEKIKQKAKKINAEEAGTQTKRSAGAANFLSMINNM